MKLTSIILFITLMQASAAGYGQKITLKESNASIERILNLIKQKSGYVFFYNRDDLPTTRITVEIKNATIEEALKESFKGIPVEWEIVKNNIVLTKKTPSFLDHILETITADDVRGRVLDERGRPLQGVTISVKGLEKAAMTNSDGRFVLKDLSQDAILQVTHIGYKTKEISVSKIKSPITITLELLENKLEEVNIVSTGYQNIPKERATGSFELVDNKLFNRSAGTDVFSRLDAVTTSTLFAFKGNSSINRRPYQGLIIRGRASFSTNGPLIVLDNLPYDGDPNNINPNDVENITLLKDAAAASIWGSRAANGVIVITTKKGTFNQPFSVTLNSNVTITNKPDLNYLKQMSSSDFIDVEKMLFGKGAYAAYLDPSTPFYPLSPVVELLNKQSGLPEADLSGRAAIDNQINEFRSYDVKKDILKYTYREGVKQQYAINLSGGDKKLAYLLSAGYDKNLDNFILTDYSRTTLRLNTTVNPIKNLSIETGIFYTKNSEANPNGASSIQLYGNYGNGGGRDLWPYSRLADGQGNPLIIDNKGFRGGFTDTIGHSLLLDWKYRPLAEKNDASSVTKSQEILLNAAARYKINDLLNAEIRYQYQKADGVQRDLFGFGSYYVRSYINLFTQFDQNKIIARPMPLGDILTLYNSHANTQTIRGQLNFDKVWQEKHQLTAIAGSEIKELHSESESSRLYGYNSNTLAFQQIDYVTTFPQINGLYGGGTIEGVDGGQFTDLTNRFVSVFANASYAYDKRYVFSLSGRRDAANFFGVASNKKWTPLWSSGFKWNINNESFYKSKLLPNLSLRITYGKNGNAPTGTPAVATIVLLPGRAPTNYPYAINNNPPNSELGMEKVSVLNLGIDFGFRNNRVTGSIEYFDKRSKDVLASAPVDPSTGFRSLLYNSAEITGKGVEILVNSHNLSLGSFDWGSNWLFTYNRPIVTHYDLKNTNVNSYVQNSGAANPIVGKDFYAVFAYPYAGLDHETGDPKGYLNGEESKDYVAIMTGSQPVSVLKYFGSALPLYYGAFRNTFSWNKFALSVNLSYRFAYYVKRDGIQYSALFNPVGSNGHSEYEQRWQQPGDELHTNVPSLNYDHPDNYSRDQFYRYSSAWIVKGDNIRFEDVNLSYTFSKLTPYIKNVRVYANANNLGILWRANKAGIDPDYGGGLNIPPSRTLVFGLTANF